MKPEFFQSYMETVQTNGPAFAPQTPQAEAKKTSKAKVKDSFDNVGKAFGEAGKMLGSATGNAAAAVGKATLQASKQMGNAVTTAAGASRQAAKDLATAVTGAVKDVASAGVKATAVSGAAIGCACKTAGSYVAALFGTVVGLVKSNIQAATNSFSGVFAKTKNGGQKELESLDKAVLTGFFVASGILLLAGLKVA